MKLYVFWAKRHVSCMDMFCIVTASCEDDAWGFLGDARNDYNLESVKDITAGVVFDYYGG